MTINVTSSSMPSFDEYCEEIQDLWNTHRLTNMGMKHKLFQKQLEEFLQVPHVSLYTNGHLALENIIAAMNFTQGSEVITTPFTFASTTHAIVRNGLVPVFCDINDHDYTMDISKIEALITDSTCAIIPVHVYGNICDDATIEDIARRHGLKVIYDAAHAFGVTVNGKSVANMGDASMFSFHATKVFNTIEGGAVCFHDDRLVQPLNDLKNFGIRGPEECAYIGSNAKMNEFQAAMGICNLRHLNDEIAKRKIVVERYRERLTHIKGIKLSEMQIGVVSNYSYFPVVFDKDVFGKNRDEISDRLADNGIGARKYFYPLTNEFECYKGQFDVRYTPIALKVSKNILTLPLYADLDIEDVDKICNVILG